MELIISSITLLTVIVGFLGLLIMMLRLHNQVRTEVRSQISEFKKEVRMEISEIKQETRDLKQEIRDLKQEIRITNMRIDSLYRELFKKDQDVA